MALLPKLKAELAHVQHPGVQFRAFPKGTKYACGMVQLLVFVYFFPFSIKLVLDKCFTSLLFRSWFCPLCGFELCGSCHARCPTLNKAASAPCIAPHCQ